MCHRLLVNYVLLTNIETTRTIYFQQNAKLVPMALNLREEMQDVRDVLPGNTMLIILEHVQTALPASMECKMTYSGNAVILALQVDFQIHLVL